MCLAIPGKIVSIEKNHKAMVDFGGARRAVQLDLVPHAGTGEYVIVHAGFAIQIVSEKDALETVGLLKEAFGEEFNQ